MRADCRLTSDLFMPVLIPALALLAGCGGNVTPADTDPTPTPSSEDDTLQLDGAYLEDSADGSLLKIVADDGIGTTAILGDDDGETLSLAGATVETGEGRIEVTLDESGRALTMTLPAGALFSFTHNEDGTFDYVFEREGIVEYEGAGLSVVDVDTFMTNGTFRTLDIDPGKVLDCADAFARGVPKARCKEAFGLEEVSDDAPLVQAFMFDGDLFKVSLGYCIYMHKLRDIFDEMEERACEGERRNSRWCDRAKDNGLQRAIGQGLGFSLGASALTNLAAQILNRAVDPTAEELCGLEAPPLEVTCDGSTAFPFTNGGFEELESGPEGFLAAWEATAGQPVVHPTKIDDQPADMPPGLNAQGEFYLELPPGAAIAQTFATEPDNTYSVSFRIAVWASPRPLVRTNVTYAVYENGEPVVKTEDKEMSITQDPTATTQRRWGAVCATSTVEIVNLADQSIFIDDVKAPISNRGGSR